MVRAQTSQFGDRLRQLRERAGLTQEELAERAGLSPAAVGALERGYRKHPHPQTIRALANALGMSDTDLRDLREAAQKRVPARPTPPADAPAAELPATFTNLVGRTRELGDLTRLFASDGARLVTLTGPGGVGKTRLALETAAALAPRFAGGVAFVSLAAVHDVDLVLPTIAEAIGVRDTSGLALAERLTHVLRDRHLLLVLDNLEHLPEAASPVAELLGSCPRLAMLATSRAPLRLRGEFEYPVPPLGVPDPDRSETIEELAANDAIALFVERARAVVPDFELTAMNAAAVAEICARLDGLPLAIELAAARVKVLQPEALLERLGAGLGFLAGGPTDQAARLRSMHAAVAWSYDLLDPEERAFFGRLAVFADGFTWEAAEAIVAGDESLPAHFVLDGVASLVDKSLLRRLETESGESRFGMLETIREYGLEQLAIAGDEAAMRGAHATYYMELAEQAWPTFRRRAGHEAWLDRLEAERGNFRAALAWLDESGDAPSLLRLTGALYWLWYVRGPVSEGRTWLEQALAAPGPNAPTVSRTRAQTGAAILAHSQGDDDTALAWLDANLGHCPEVDDPWCLASTLLVLGLVAEDRGEYSQAESRFAEALTLLRAANDRPNAALAILHLGIVAWGQGNVQRATALFEESVSLQREEGEAWGLSISLAYLGLIAAEGGELTRAAIVHRESLTLRWEARAWEEVAGSLADLATLAAAVERPEQAARLFGAAGALVEELGRAVKLPERAVYDRAQARSRATLGDEAFALAQSAGRKLPREQAVAEAAALADELARSVDESDQT